MNDDMKSKAGAHKPFSINDSAKPTGRKFGESANASNRVFGQLANPSGRVQPQMVGEPGPVSQSIGLDAKPMGSMAPTPKQPSLPSTTGGNQVTQAGVSAPPTKPNYIFEAFMDAQLSEAGGRKMKARDNKGAIYRSGPFKNLTKGQAYEKGRRMFKELDSNQLKSYEDRANKRDIRTDKEMADTKAYDDAMNGVAQKGQKQVETPKEEPQAQQTADIPPIDAPKPTAQPKPPEPAIPGFNPDPVKPQESQAPANPVQPKPKPKPKAKPPASTPRKGGIDPLLMSDTPKRAGKATKRDKVSKAASNLLASK